jgi:AbrB family looped-hinge helix DNA binding protein
MGAKTSRVGKRGSIVIPADVRRKYGFEEGSLVLVEEGDEGVSLRPAVALPVEIYGPRRRAELLLENAVDEEDYRRAAEEVRKLGLDPAEIPHEKP